jgi:PilZ domain
MVPWTTHRRPMDDKRKAPRRRVLKEGKIVFADAMRVIDCTIRDMSKEGARLLIASSVGVPDTFNLYEKSTGLLYPTTIVWRQSNALGVKFEGPATSIHDAVNKRFARLRHA